MPSPSALLITDLWESTTFDVAGVQIDTALPNDVPTPTVLASFDLVLVVGPLRKGERGLELAGAIKLALEKGATVVYLYGPRFDDIDERIARGFGIVGGRVSGKIRPAASNPEPHPAFREYLTLHGQADQHFTEFPAGSQVLAHAILNESPPMTGPMALFVEYESGSLYYLPHHSAGDFGVLLSRLVGAVAEHQEGALATLPTFFDDLRVPGEDAVTTGIEEAEQTLTKLKAERDALVRHKLLVGHASGEQLERLVIEELNLVLAKSDVSAQDVEERGVEDFELIDGSGERIAIAESKAAAGGVTLTHVNQLNSHRSELFDAAAEELPGLLVVNTFRNDDSLDGRQGEGVHERVIRHARRMNVLVLRTWDLFQLVARRLSGEDDSAALLQALSSGGGWLEVTESGVHHRTGEAGSN